jgi:hypothetical protein
MNNHIEVHTREYLKQSSSFLGTSNFNSKLIESEAYPRLSDEQISKITEAELDKLLQLVKEKKAELKRKWGYEIVCKGEYNSFGCLNSKQNWQHKWDEFIEKGGYKVYYLQATGRLKGSNQATGRLNGSNFGKFKLKSQSPQSTQQEIQSVPVPPNGDYISHNVFNGTSDKSDPANKKPRFEAPNGVSPDKIEKQLNDENLITDEKPKFPLKKIMIAAAIIGIGFIVYRNFLKK